MWGGAWGFTGKSSFLLAWFFFGLMSPNIFCPSTIITCYGNNPVNLSGEKLVWTDSKTRQLLSLDQVPAAQSGQFCWLLCLSLPVFSNSFLTDFLTEWLLLLFPPIYLLLSFGLLALLTFLLSLRFVTVLHACMHLLLKYSENKKVMT